ncbi:MAG: BACON domain-containing protein, partial [Prevotella sp.]|nr:BACON domain-containing protein [Prevotella sp.]
KPTILSVEKSVVEFSSNGGNKSVEVYSNSNSIEKDNNNRNWKVVSKPQWINIIGEEFKEKGILGKLEDKVKGLVKKSSTSAEDPSVITSIMKIVVSSKSKNEPSRNGKIVISSDKQQATIIVHQK